MANPDSTTLGILEIRCPSSSPNLRTLSLVIFGPGPTWELGELVPAILVLPRPAQPKGTTILIRLAWLGVRFGVLLDKTVLVHVVAYVV